MSRFNLEDIAKRAGVSRSTVSRVINNSDAVSEKTRQVVQAIIDEMGFAPNPAARTLVTRRTQVIGVVIPGVEGFAIAFGEALYFPLIMQGVAEATDVHDYAMLMWIQDPSTMDEERFYQRILRSRLMDGLIVASPTHNPDFINKLRQTGTPFVMIDHPGNLANEVNWVGVDNIQASKMAVEHLIENGRRRIGTITGFRKNIEAQHRLAGYRLALEEAGLPYQESLVLEGWWHRQSGYRLASMLLEQGVDAIFTANDETALGVLDAFDELQVCVPDDVAVVGFDDLPAASRTTPALTTVRQPIKGRGVQATELLLDLIEERVTAPRQILLPAELVVRQSSRTNLPVKGVIEDE